VLQRLNECKYFFSLGMGQVGNLLHNAGCDTLRGGRWSMGTPIALAVPLLLHQPLELLIDPVQKIPIIHKGVTLRRLNPQTCRIYVFIRYSSLGQTQYIPPGIPADLITRVATMGVVHCGQGFPCWIESLSLPRLALAVLLSFPPDAIPKPPKNREQ
jgi:hypothetical protein